MEEEEEEEVEEEEEAVMKSYCQFTQVVFDMDVLERGRGQTDWLTGCCQAVSSRQV